MDTVDPHEREALRTELARRLGIPPDERVPLEAEARGEVALDGIVIEKWVFSAEPGSRVPALLYRPADAAGAPRPAIVLTHGHDGHKSQSFYQYVAQLYAHLGLACLVPDPIGEEERNPEGRMAVRAHDHPEADRRAAEAGRRIMGKLVFDTMRGIDFLLSREDVDPARIGVAGNSLGGATASWLAALETRPRLVLVCGWALGDYMLETGKPCTCVPNRILREVCTWDAFVALASPEATVVFMNGDADTIIDRKPDGTPWRELDAVVAAARPRFAAAGGSPDALETWYEPGGGHRPYMVHPAGVERVRRVLGTPALGGKEVAALPTVNGGAWADAHELALEPLYGVDLHLRGATLVSGFPIRPLPPEELACLRPDERGDPLYTLTGWLDVIEENKRRGGGA